MFVVSHLLIKGDKIRMNKHIKEACQQYVSQMVNPEYAIMLNGPWGCGKTHFITKLQKEDWLKNNDDKSSKVVNISLYGVASKEDIEQCIFNGFVKVQGKLENEENNIELPGWMKAIGAGTKAFVESKFSIDTKAMMPYILQDCIKKIRTIIIDDLERASMPTHEIMGYFYNFFIEQGIRVIFIGNEDEIKNDNGVIDEHYIRTKEKVIGETYTIQPQISDAIKTFLQPEQKINILLAEKRAIDICLRVVERLEMVNLRTIWQGLIRVQRLLSSINECKAFNSMKYLEDEYGDDDHTKEDYLAEVLELYLVLYMQMTTGEVTKEGVVESKGEIDSKNIIKEAIGVYKHELCSLKTLNMREEQESIEKKQRNNQVDIHSITRSLRREPRGFVALLSSGEGGYMIWADYLFESKIDIEQLNKVVDEDKQWFTPKKNVKSNLYILISESINMEDAEFQSCYSTVKSELMLGNYTEIGELMHAYAQCLTYKEFGVREYEEHEIRDFFDEVLSKTIVKVESRDSSWSIYDRSSMGYQYSSNMRIGEGKLFADKLRELELAARIDMNKKMFIDEFNAVASPSELSQWISLLYVNNSGRDYNLYYDKPVLSWLGSAQVFSKINNFSFSEQLDFIDSLKGRYEMRYSNGEFKNVHYPDYEVLVELEKEYTLHIDSIGVGHIQNYRLLILNRRLQELISYCNSFIVKEETKI